MFLALISLCVVATVARRPWPGKHVHAGDDTELFGLRDPQNAISRAGRCGTRAGCAGCRSWRPIRPRAAQPRADGVRRP